MPQLDGKLAPEFWSGTYECIALGWILMEPSRKPTKRETWEWTWTVLFSFKRIASPGSMHDTGCSGLVHRDDPEEWYGDGGGRGVQDGEHMYTHGGFMLMYAKPIQYCKVISLQLKYIIFFKKKEKLWKILAVRFPTSLTKHYHEGGALGHLRVHLDFGLLKSIGSLHA